MAQNLKEVKIKGRDTRSVTLTLMLITKADTACTSLPLPLWFSLHLSRLDRGLSDQTDAKTEASKPPTTSSVAEPATETEAKRISAAVVNGMPTAMY